MRARVCKPYLTYNSYKNDNINVCHPAVYSSLNFKWFHANESVTSCKPAHYQN